MAWKFKCIYFLFLESDNVSLASSTSGQYYSHSKESRPSNASSTYYAGQMSATESSRGDDVHDSSDNESTRGKLLVMAGERCYNIRIG